MRLEAKGKSSLHVWLSVMGHKGAYEESQEFTCRGG